MGKPPALSDDLMEFYQFQNAQNRVERDLNQMPILYVGVYLSFSYNR